MKRETKHLSSGGTVDIFDDVFSYSEMVKFARIFEKSHYTLTGRATSIFDQQSDPHNWQSAYNDKDIKFLGIFDSINFKPIECIIGDKKISKSWVNCFTPSSYTSYHCDSTQKNTSKSFLYYANTEWKKGQGGETLLYNNILEPEIIIEYKPNRVLLFDSEIPHKPLQHLSSNLSNPYRFTFVTIFKKMEEKYEHILST